MSIDSAHEEGEIGYGGHPALLHREADLSLLPMLSQLPGAGKEINGEGIGGNCG
jgi:hypothetical protein